jgi:hypothetical protein
VTSGPRYDGTVSSESRPPADGRRRRKSFLQELESIPEDVRNNPYILRRTNRYVVPSTASPPRVALPPEELRERDLPELDPYTEAMFSREQPGEEPTPEQLERSSSQLRVLQRVYTNLGQYQEAKRACAARRRVKEQLRSRTAFDREKGDIERLICKRNELIALVQSTDDDWDRLIDAHAERTRKKLAELAEQQEAESDDFDCHVPMDLPPLFRRNSVAYLRMRSKERNLALAEQFDEATEMQLAADRLQARERVVNFEKVDALFRNRRVRLQDQQDLIFSGCVECAVRRKERMAACKAKDARGQQKRIENLERQIVAKCEQKGIKQGQIDLDLVDESRIALVKAKEDENPVSPKRNAATRIRTGATCDAPDRSFAPEREEPDRSTRPDDEDAAEASE